MKNFAPQNYLNLIHVSKNGCVEGEATQKPERADTSLLRLAQLQYVNNVCTNFQKNCCNTVGICDTKLLTFGTRRTYWYMDTQTDGQTGGFQYTSQNIRFAGV